MIGRSRRCHVVAESAMTMAMVSDSNVAGGSAGQWLLRVRMTGARQAGGGALLALRRIRKILHFQIQDLCSSASSAARSKASVSA